MNHADQHRISRRHLQRAAFVYVRQSKLAQVRDHPESTSLQRGLQERAIELGWSRPIVVEDDLGITAGGFVARPGFQRLLTEVTMRKVGIVICMDASRLSRNSKDWAHLFEMCGHFDTLVADVQQVYDVAIANDRLVLQIKGTVAELELSSMQSRLQRSIESKAARGELKVVLPPGYVYGPDGQIIIDPDERVQQAIRCLFEEFEYCTSGRQLALSYRDSNRLFPTKKQGTNGPTIWANVTPEVIYKVISHPMYAGAYTRGRTKSFIDCVDEKLVKRTKRIPSPQDWKVCLKDHHEGYISWEQYEKNRAKLAESKPRWRANDNASAIRTGAALLAGLLRCGHCGRRLYVKYRKAYAVYHCHGATPQTGDKCLSVGAKSIEQYVGEQLCRAVEPLAIVAAQVALDEERVRYDKAVEEAQLRMQAAQYSADRAFTQYDGADPKNRLVVNNLERRLNQKLEEVESARQHHQQCETACPSLTDSQKKELDWLSRNFEVAWERSGTLVTFRKQLLREVIREIFVKHIRETEELEVTIHWHGDACTTARLHKTSRMAKAVEATCLIEQVRALSTALNDAETARVLNMKGILTPRDLRWSQDRVTRFRRKHGIRRLESGMDGSTLSCQQAQDYLGISHNALRSLVRRGVVESNQVTAYAPWRISREALETEEVQTLVQILKAQGRLPPHGGSPDVQTELFPT